VLQKVEAGVVEQSSVFGGVQAGVVEGDRRGRRRMASPRAGLALNIRTPPVAAWAAKTANMAAWSSGARWKKLFQASTASKFSTSAIVRMSPTTQRCAGNISLHSEISVGEASTPVTCSPRAVAL
jgi:hypothetical protein